jgi:GDP-mannose 4,6 dehydratase
VNASPISRAVFTGGAGFLGSHICERLLNEGWDVLCLDNFLTSAPRNIGHLQSNPRFQLIRMDVADYIDIPCGIDVIYHFASPASPVDYLNLPLRRVPVFGKGQHLGQRVYVDVANLARAVLVAVVGKGHDVAGPELQRFAGLLRISGRTVASRTRFASVPLAPTVAPARCYERLGRHPRIQAEQLQCLAEDNAFAIDDATCNVVEHANSLQSKSAAKSQIAV